MWVYEREPLLPRVEGCLRIASARTTLVGSRDWKAVGSVVTAPRDDPNARGFDVNVEAIAVPLDFKGPLRADRNLGREGRETRFDPVRHRIPKERALSIRSRS